jgi:hypothetical protein
MQPTTVVRNLREAAAHNPNEPAYIEVPGRWVRAMAWLVDVLENPGDDEVGKTIKTLLRKLEMRE